VNKTLYTYLNSSKKEGENVTMPRLEINLNEYNISIGYDTLFNEISDTCYMSLRFTLVNNTGALSYKDFDDIFMVGPQYFQTLQGMQWNFDTKKVALMPYPASPYNPNPVNPIIPANKGGLSTGIIILLVVVGLGVVGGLGFYCYKKKQLNSDLSSGKYDRI
jgi:hypothetical protein